MVTTGHQKLPKMGQNSINSSFFGRRAKKASAEGRSSPQELEVGPRSGPYLLVYLITEFSIEPTKYQFKTAKVGARSRDVSPDKHYSICSD